MNILQNEKLLTSTECLVDTAGQGDYWWYNSQ